jgi:hypothetical protein
LGEVDELGMQALGGGVEGAVLFMRRLFVFDSSVELMLVVVQIEGGRENGEPLMQRYEFEKQVKRLFQGSRRSATRTSMGLIKQQPPVTRKNGRLLKERSTADLEQPDLTIDGKTLRHAE